MDDRSAIATTSIASAKARGLGRGLSALIPGASPAGRREFFHVPVEEIFPSPDQPRKRFADELIAELAESIRAHGVIQPLVVRRRAEGGYFLIAGERRWRASQRAALAEVPVVVQEVAPREAFERALVENLQRADLNPIEEATAYQRLVAEYGYTQEEVAHRVGKDRATVANSLRLLKLPAKVRALVEEGKLSMGHARALLPLEAPAAIESAAASVMARGLTVRATEALVKKQVAGGAAPRASAPAQGKGKSASVRDLEHRLTRSLGAPVAVSEGSDGGGTIEIRYANLDDLDRILERLLAAR